MARFWAMVAFMLFFFAASCEKNGFFADEDAGGADTETLIGAETDASARIDANADTDVNAAENDNDYTDEDAFPMNYPDIAGAWTFACQSDIIGGVDFNLNFFFFQDGTSIRGVERESEDAYCYGAVFGDGQVSLIMEEACTGSTVTFTGVVVDLTFISGRYSWEWTDAFGAPHHDEGVWRAGPSPDRCPPYPSVNGGWTLTYENGCMESTTITVEQTENTFRGQGLDGCEYLGAFSLAPECNDLRIYRRCPDLTGQTRVLFGILRDTGRMSGAWYDMNDTFGCPEIKSGSWRAIRP